MRSVNTRASLPDLLRLNMNSDEEAEELGAFDIIHAVFLYLSEKSYPMVVRTARSDALGERQLLFGLKKGNFFTSKNLAAR